MLNDAKNSAIDQHYLIQRLLYLACVLFVSCTIFLLSHKEESYWLVITAVIFAFLPSFSWKKNIFIGLCAIAYLFAVNLLFVVLIVKLIPGFIITPLFIGIVGILYLFAYQQQRYARLLFLLSLFTLLILLFPVTTFAVFERLSFFTLGICFVFVLHFLFFQFKKNILATYYYQKFLLQLAQFCQNVFATLIERDYADHKYLYERRIHDTERKTSWFLDKLTKYDNYLTQRALPAKIDDYSLLYAQLQDLSLIRIRVTDQDLFAICRAELVELGASLRDLLYIMQANCKIKLISPGNNCDAKAMLCANKLAKFNEAIKKFETINANVLQITAADPLALVLFVAALKNISINLEAMFRIKGFGYSYAT